ncbi:MAG: serine hydrolase [bacterium]
MHYRCFVISLQIAFLIWSPLSAQDESLKEKFSAQLHAMVQAADAVVGVTVKDLKTGETFGFHQDEVFPQASSIKIHILAEVYRQAEQGNFKLSDKLPLKESVRVEGSGVLNLLGKGTVSMSIRDYVVLMMVLSDNSATNLEEEFPDKISTKPA